MNLVTDFGNTLVKIALVDDDSITKSLRSVDEGEIVDFIGQYSGRFHRSIISTVREVPSAVMKLIEAKSDFLHILSPGSELPFKIDYDTPDTLGMDRVAAVAGAYNKYDAGSVLVIDAGTAITYDVLFNGRYSGGSISPGIDMRFRALNSFTGRLPLVERDETIEYPARSTRSGINSGVLIGIVFEINEYIREFEKKYSDTLVILTGGDAGFLSGKISAYHEFDPDLVINGLNYILNYNARKNK
ncbi:MAG: type III pantothenate kinase [Bacteroidales bacterium]|nr:type III pantothenate kinase [Bacteroidales bacterium]